MHLTRLMLADHRVLKSAIANSRVAARLSSDGGISEVVTIGLAHIRKPLDAFTGLPRELRTRHNMAVQKKKGCHPK
jgi:hypothetical protein